MKKHVLVGKGRMSHDFKPLEVLDIIQAAVMEDGQLLADLKAASPVILEAACKALITADRRIADLERAMTLAVANKTLRQKEVATDANT